MFEFNYIIKAEDINMGNHVGNERAVLFFQYTRTEFLKKFNLNQLNVGDNYGLIQEETFVKYKKQLFLNQKIKVVIDKIEVVKLKIIFYFSIYLKDTTNIPKELVINGYTTMIVFDYEKQKVRRIPEYFKEICLSYNKDI